MTKFDAVLNATRIALRESTFDAEALEATRYVRGLPRDYQTEARAAVNFVYQHGHAPRMLRHASSSARMLEAS